MTIDKDDLRTLETLVGGFASEYDARIGDLEQKIARRGPDGSAIGGGGRSLGQRVLADASVVSMLGSPGRRGMASVRVSSSDLVQITTATAGSSADTLVIPGRERDIVSPPTRRLTVRALLNAGSTVSNAVQVMREIVFLPLSTTASITSGSSAVTAIASTTGMVTGGTYSIAGTGIPAGATMLYNGSGAGTLSANATATNAAAAVTISRSLGLAAGVVVEGSTKPQSEMQFELLSSPVRTLATFIEASKQILEDAPVLQNYIDTRLRYALGYAEEIEMLYGDNTGEHLNGLIPQATAYADPLGLPAGHTQIDTLAAAITQSENSLLPASAIILNNQDFRSMTLLKDSQNRFLLGSPIAQTFQRIWELPIVATPAMLPNHFLAGNFNLAATVYDREEANIMLSTEDSDAFRRNLVVIRGEQRLCLAVSRPQALVYGAFG